MAQLRPRCAAAPAVKSVPRRQCIVDSFWRLRSCGLELWCKRKGVAPKAVTDLGGDGRTTDGGMCSGTVWSGNARDSREAWGEGGDSSEHWPVGRAAFDLPPRIPSQRGTGKREEQPQRCPAL